MSAAKLLGIGGTRASAYSISKRDRERAAATRYAVGGDGRPWQAATDEGAAGPVDGIDRQAAAGAGSVDLEKMPARSGFGVGAAGDKAWAEAVDGATQGFALTKRQASTAKERWKDYGLDLRWVHTWELKSQYTTPRDTVALLQLQHRNLYVAKSLGLADARCRAHGCNDTENQTHVFRCRKIQTGFWEPVNKAMKDLGFQGSGKQRNVLDRMPTHGRAGRSRHQRGI